jgi:8-oxo-dGTP pyrophosphatase MutT (NUDIX family)
MSESNSSNPNPAPVSHKKRAPKKPLDVVAFDNAMHCARSTDFALCAGTVTCRGTGAERRVLVVFNERYTSDLWQLPKGRKNMGEDSLGTTAIRETYEETGYKVELLVRDIPTRATMAEARQGQGIFEARNTEPIALVFYTEPNLELNERPVTKVCFFFVAAAADDAVQTADTQDIDEYLTPSWLTCAEAMEKLTFTAEKKVLEIAMSYW